MRDKLNKNIDHAYTLRIKTTDDCLETMWNKDEFDLEMTDFIIKHVENMMSEGLKNNKVIMIPYIGKVNQNINNNIDFKGKMAAIKECYEKQDYKGVQRIKESLAKRKMRELCSGGTKVAKDHWMKSKIGKYYYNMNEFSKEIMSDVPYDEELDKKLEEFENENVD